MGGLHNGFSSETRNLFLYNNECWECGTNKPDAGHHIVGRGLGDSTLETSPLNFAPLHNQRCHIGRSFTDEITGYYLVHTFHYLTEKCRYVPTDQDLAFKAKYQRLYELGYKYAAENYLPLF